MREQVTSYRYGEGATKEGQIVQFSAPVDEFELAKDSLQHFKYIRTPDSAEVNVEHGGYGRYSRYDIEQVDYGGGQNEAGGGYYEILDIKNAPNERESSVSHGYLASGEHVSEFFAEWESIDAAKAHWERMGRGRILTLDSFKEDEEVPGLIRVVETGFLTPWFYAVGDAALVGDYVFPEHLAQDPTFTFGRQFLVPEKPSFLTEEYFHQLKTCMGCVVRDEPSKPDRFGRQPEQPGTVRKYRAVQWHDGSVSEVYPSTRPEMLPIPLAQGDAWVTEAQRKFNRMLGGAILNFEVKFADGGKFVGKYVPAPEQPKLDPEGDYLLVVTLDNGEVLKGWVNNFIPTHENPGVVSYVERRYREMNKNIVKIETVERKTKRGGRKWSGVYHASLNLDNSAKDE